MAMTAGSLSSDSELDDDRFFVAAPGVKRSKSNDTDRRDEDPVASTSRLEEESDVPPARYSPHKRVRTKAPAPPQGVKRAIANRRLSDRSLQAEQARHSDGDGSFTRQPPPKKRQRSAANLKRVDREDSVPAIDEAPTPAPRRTIRAKKKATKPRVSASFNFTPVTNLSTFSSNGTDSLLEIVETSRQCGNEAYHVGDYTAALKAYSHALDQYPAGVQDLPPPLSLLSNRAAAYIALGRWDAALQDMRKAFCYPCSDTEGNVKRFTRYARCLLALAKVEGDEVTEVLRHMEDQLYELDSLQRNAPTKTLREGWKTFKDLSTSKYLMGTINTARENAQYGPVLHDLDKLIKIQSDNKREGPPEWWMMYTEALAWQGRATEAEEMFEEKLSTVTPQNSPASNWLHALLCCGRGEMDRTVEFLEKLRLATGELPKQASRLLHKAYSIKTHWEKVLEGVQLEDISRMKVNIQRIQQLADIPIMAEVARQISVYSQLALSMMNADKEVASNMKNPDYQYPNDLRLRMKGHAILAKSLYRLSLYKEAGEACAEAVLVHEGSPDDGSLQRERAEIDKILEDIRQKQDLEIEALRKAGPYQILGLPSTATKADIKKAYKAQSLAHHPDKPTGNAERFKLISEAYQTLMAPPSTPRFSSNRYR